MSNQMAQLQEATIKAQCKALRMPMIASQFGSMAEQAIREKKSHIGYLEALLFAEIEERERNTIERRIKDVFFDRVERLRPHVAKLEIATPDCTGTDEAFAVLRSLAFVAAHSGRAAQTPELVSPNIHANLEEARRYGIAELAAALSAQTAAYAGCTLVPRSNCSFPRSYWPACQ